MEIMPDLEHSKFLFDVITSQFQYCILHLYETATGKKDQANLRKNKEKCSREGNVLTCKSYWPANYTNMKIAVTIKGNVAYCPH